MKEYQKPILIEEKIIVDDICADSTESVWGDASGDVEHSWPFNK